MAQVEHRGLAGQAGEAGQVGGGAVDDDGVGGHGADADAGGKVVEVAAAGAWTMWTNLRTNQRLVTSSTDQSEASRATN